MALDMTEQEARATMKALGWSFLKRQHKGRYWFVYAARKQAGQRQERYIGSLASLERLTVEALQQKLS